MDISEFFLYPKFREKKYTNCHWKHTLHSQLNGLRRYAENDDNNNRFDYTISILLDEYKETITTTTLTKI